LGRLASLRLNKLNLASDGRSLARRQLIILGAAGWRAVAVD
jgi:hypothetical protein